MDKESITAIVEQLRFSKNALEIKDGHFIDSIFIDQDYDKEGNKVYGVSIRYSSDVTCGTLALLAFLEDQVGKKCLWYRLSPKVLFVYFD